MLLSSCSKQDKSMELNVPNTNQQQLLAENQPANQDAIVDRIHAFKEVLKNAENGVEFRNDELSIEDAIWGIEALMNIKYAMPAIEFTDMQKQLAVVPINTNQGVLSNQEVATAYAQVKEALQTHINSVYSSNERSFIAIDLESTTVNNSPSIQVVSYIRKKTNVVPPLADVFGETDYWFWGNGLGRCNGLPGGDDEDAADQLFKELNARRPLPPNFLSFTNLENKSIFPEDPYGADYFNYNNTNNDPQRQYLIYSFSGPININHCFSPATMDWFYDNWVTAINDLKPPGKIFSHLDELVDDYLIIGNTELDIHYGTPVYGETVHCPCPPCIIVLPNNTFQLIDCECC